MLKTSIFRRKGGGRSRNTLPFWLILPTIVVLLAIQVYPALYTVWLSLQEREPTGWNYVGVQNFERLFNMGVFGESVGHTVVFLLGYTSLTLFLAFIIALLLNRNVRLSGLYITLLFIPWIVADIIAGMVFRLLVIPDYGLLSGILQNPSVIPPDGVSVLTAVRPAPWFGNFPFPPSPAMILLILASVWRALPFVTLLLLAAMQTIPYELIESSRIDGARAWQIVRYIMVPLMLPMMVVALFSLTLSGMNGVGMVFSLTGGGPGTSTQVLSYLLFTLGWDRLQFGRAAALAIMIAAVNLVLISGTLRLTRVNEEIR
ncbi:MAG: sugar ABC transporter permease [Candidatus Promineifilaceae bacterium]